MQIAEASAEFVAPLKAAQQQEKARKQAIQKSLQKMGPVRRSSRAAAAVTRAKMSQQPAGHSDSDNASEGSSGRESPSSSKEQAHEAQHEVYDPTGGFQICQNPVAWLQCTLQSLCLCIFLVTS